MAAPANDALGLPGLPTATCECGCSKRFLPAGASRDCRVLRSPFLYRVRATYECRPPLCARSGSCTPHELHAPAGASSECRGRTHAASSAKGRAKREAAKPHRRRYLPEAEAFPAAESATSNRDRDAECAWDAAQT